MDSVWLFRPDPVSPRSPRRPPLPGAHAFRTRPRLTSAWAAMAVFGRRCSSKCLSSTSVSHPYTWPSPVGVEIQCGAEGIGPRVRRSQRANLRIDPSVQLSPPFLCNLRPPATFRPESQRHYRILPTKIAGAFSAAMGDLCQEAIEDPVAGYGVTAAEPAVEEHPHSRALPPKRTSTRPSLRLRGAGIGRRAGARSRHDA